MTLNLTIPQSTYPEFAARLVVVGVGTGGSAAVNYMIASKLKGVEFFMADTDGLRAGLKPEAAKREAEEAADELYRRFDGAHMAFIVAGMGGATGTGAAPVIARMARERNLLTVGLVTKPFGFEGIRRARIAEQGIQELNVYVDTLVVIRSQNLLATAHERTSHKEAFKMADHALYTGVRCVTDLMVVHGLVNLDFADIRVVMAEMGRAVMGTAEAEGEDRAIRAAVQAINNPLSDDTSLDEARGLLLNITGGDDLTLFEVDQAANRIREEVSEDANVIFGSAVDEALGGRIRVTLLATGLEPHDKSRLVVTDASEKVEEVLGPLPVQGPGPRFGMNFDYMIALAEASEMDDAGNHVSRIEQLLPVIRRAAERASLSINPNEFPELHRDLTDYLNAISGLHRNISWGTVFGLGVMLENSASAAKRAIDDRLRPSLEDTAQSSLESLLTLHGPLIVATSEGRELQEQADLLRMSQQDQLDLKADAEELASQLKDSEGVMETEAAEVLTKAAATIGTGRFAERGTAYGIGTIKNFTTILVSAAGLAAVAHVGSSFAGGTGGIAGAGITWLGFEALKKTQDFARLTAALGSQYDRLMERGDKNLVYQIGRLAPFRSFVINNQKALRQIAANTRHLNWMVPYINFVAKNNAPDRRAHQSQSTENATDLSRISGAKVGAKSPENGAL
jgi:cell division protein FtsZ